MSTVSTRSDAESGAPPLAALLDDLAGLLPAQGPISIFIHHNTLHAFEDRPFDEAVEHAADVLDREPYLPESRYRAKLASGRILESEIDAVLCDALGERAEAGVAGAGRRIDLWRAVLCSGIPDADGPELDWILQETPALARFRADLPAAARSALDALVEPSDPAAERAAVLRLWRACVAAVEGAAPPPAPPAPRIVRHRDALVAASACDIDAWIHPPLIRFLAGYLDQGLSHWPMPGRNRGLHGCFLDLYDAALAAQCGLWARRLPRLVADDRSAGRDSLESIAHSLADLGVGPDEAAEYLGAELLSLRGWAGIVRQIEERPDRVPARDVPVTLGGYLAVRLLLERAALDEAARAVGFDGALRSLRSWLEARRPADPAPRPLERAWPLFHLGQLCGLDPSLVERWTPGDVASLESELGALDDPRRRRILHAAFERSIRHRLYDALVQHAPAADRPAPDFQAIFCLDEREESFRRHLEEAANGETLSTAGFFNVAMYHQSASDAHARPLCPVATRPDHYVGESEPTTQGLMSQSRHLHRRAVGFLGYNVHVGSRLPLRGAVLTAAFGWLTLVPLILRVVFPWLFARWTRVQELPQAPGTRLLVDRRDETPPVGTYTGFTPREMADIVRRVLEDVGVSQRLARLVLVVGHGSVSLNNPHESAHDCGACGGGRGGPNARAFAQMANDPRVREVLAADGLDIGVGTWFVGAQRNTCNNDVLFYDDDLIPEAHREAFDRTRAAIDAARRGEAHERCRRFDAAPLWYPPVAALAHVQGRAADLAQPRPEYGHATNAFCVVGRRRRTRGLFLDRRAFLVSYDPTEDDDGTTLARVLAAVVPVVAGINLEYYFSYVDPTGYGCGTKLPHNVTSLLGVMDGAQSDLRTGLPWQMVEIHEPTRLALVVEAPRDRLRRVVEALPAIHRVVRNRWLWLACLAPDAGALWEFRGGTWIPHQVGQPLPVIRGESAAWYGGKRGFVPPAAIVPA